MFVAPGFSAVALSLRARIALISIESAFTDRSPITPILCYIA
ncbi:hypothetical protein [Neoehrlichia mikurensis]|nr:hypothetical protein [Neoehrlichia mikurensis]